MIPRRRFLKLAVAAGAVPVVGVGVYTRFVEPYWVEVVERRLPVAKLPRDLVGRRLVQLSDLHIGPHVDDQYLITSFQRVRDLSPDFVAYTGDWSSYSPDVFSRMRAVASHLPTGRRGTFGILGNHDYGPNWAHPEVGDHISALVTAAGVRVLRNEVAESNGLHVVGLDDWWANRFLPRNAFAQLPREAAIVALSHNPDTVDLPGWEGYSGWILSGHTHGGQCKPPFLPPPLVPVKNRRYTAGELGLAGGRRLYINRGLGHLFAVRFNVRPEITLFRLERA